MLYVLIVIVVVICLVIFGVTGFNRLRTTDIAALLSGTTSLTGFAG